MERWFVFGDGSSKVVEEEEVLAQTEYG